MSTEEILSVKEDIGEIKGDIKGLVTTVNNLKVSIVENYIKKTDCKECKENRKADKQPFWDTDTKKSAFKWGGIIFLVIIILLAGKDIFQLTNILPK